MLTNFNKKEKIYLSKLMTKILRPKDYGLNIDDEGFN